MNEHYITQIMSKNQENHVSIQLGNNKLIYAEGKQWIIENSDLDVAAHEIINLTNENERLQQELLIREERCHLLERELKESQELKEIALTILANERKQNLTLKKEVSAYREELQKCFKEIIQLKQIMKKLMKQVNKSMKSGAETIANAADLLVLDGYVGGILRRIKIKMQNYDFSTIQTPEELTPIYETWCQEAYREYDKSAGITDDDTSNIAQRRRKLRRGLDEGLPSFCKYYEVFKTQGIEKLSELKAIDDLMNNLTEELQKQEETFGSETPDLIEIRYNELKQQQLLIFQTKLIELKLTLIDSETLAEKTENLEARFEEMKATFVERRHQITEQLWKIIQQEFRLVANLIEEKRSLLISNMPTDAKVLASEIESFKENFNSRFNSLLPKGVDQIQAITIYMCQFPDTQDSTDAKPSSLEQEEIITLQSLQLQVLEFSALKAKNEAAIRQKLMQLATSYNYRLVESFEIYETP